MSHTQTKELNKIVIGSGTVFVVAWPGYVPEDDAIEQEENMLGRVKNGANIAYSTNYYKAVSDDGKARKTKFISDEASFGYGAITWNAFTLKRLISTIRINSDNTKRTAKIGGAENDTGKQWLLRFVVKDPKDGDIRLTLRGVNTGGWAAAFGNTETILQPKFEAEPLDEEGTLILYEEEVLEAIIDIDTGVKYPDLDTEATSET